MQFIRFLKINLCVIKVDEFYAIGYGGLYSLGKSWAIVVSMGTGTVYVKATENFIVHIRGSGVGRGTLIWFSEKLLNITNLYLIDKYIKKDLFQKLI